MGKLSRLEIKTLRRKQNIVSRYLASLVITTVVVVASFRLFRPLEAKITNIELLQSEMYVSTFVIPNEDLIQGTLKVTLESTSTYQEQPISVGDSVGYFTDLIYGRTYKIKIKGDVGYGLQTFYEQTYYLRKAISVDMSFSQYQHTIYYQLSGYDLFNMIPSDTFYVDMYEEGTFIRRDTYTIDPTRYLTGYGELLEIKADSYTYQFVIKYDYRGGEAILYETNFLTTTNPTIEGEVFGGLDYIGYYLYINDFALKIKGPEAKVILKGNGYETETLYPIDTNPMIQDNITLLEPGYYELTVYLDLGKGFEQYYQAYVEVGGLEQTWAN